MNVNVQRANVQRIIKWTGKVLIGREKNSARLSHNIVYFLIQIFDHLSLR